MGGAVFVVVVNYRTPALAIACLKALEPQRPALRGGRVLVVDNCSGDDSVPSIGAAISAAGWSEWIELLPMPRNGGFAYGNNAGVERVRALDPGFAAVVLLNPDTEVQPGCLEALVRFLESNSDVGIVGSAITGPGGATERSAHRWPSPLSELAGAAQLAPLSRLLRAYAVAPAARQRATRCDWVSGACFTIRREVLDAVGPLDEGYFLYFEEVDFCRRARLAGWLCAHVPDAGVVHHEGASTGIRTGARRRPAYWYASRRRFFVKCYGVLGLLLSDLLWAIGRTTLVLRRTFGFGGLAGRAHEPAAYALDLLGGDLKALLRGELRGVARITGHAR
jgi:GT2 family glycosyltransferase